MANHLKGKVFFVCFLLLLSSLGFSSVLASSDSASASTELEHENEDELSSNDQESESENPSSFDQQRALLQRLDELVMNLSQIVTRLESKLSDQPRTALGDSSRDLAEAQKSGLLETEKEKIVEEEEEAKPEGKIVRDVEKSRASSMPVSVTKYSPLWSERFQFVSAVKLDSQATCIEVLPFRDYEGLSKYVAVGDQSGTVYIFLRNGDVQVQFQTPSNSPITSMASYFSIHKNESFVITGHQNGAVSMHRVWEDRSSSAAAGGGGSGGGGGGDDWSSLLFVETVAKFGDEDFVCGGLAISLLEVHNAGRFRYILATDSKGKIWVFRENGTFHGSASPNGKPLAFLKQRLLFLTETGAGSLDLRTMKVRESDCEGLNNSMARNYVFDVTERNKAYGFTSDGDLIHVLLLGDVMNFKCRVRSKRRFELDEPLALEAIKGYLILVNGDGVFVYNVSSSQHYVRLGAPRILFSAGLNEIKASFLTTRPEGGGGDPGGLGQRFPLVASNREKFVVVGLGGGYVGMYRSNLPIYKSEFNSMFWTSPVLFFVLFLFGAWHFFAKKKEALTSWGPDDPFSGSAAAAAVSTTAASGGAPASSGERSSFMESSSRNSDVMDLRGNSLRGPTRRYVSPPRYGGGGGGGGATSSFRPSSVDQRGTSVDQNFRASDLKYRGTGLDSSGFPKRRDNLFVNTQGVDDSN